MAYQPYIYGSAAPKRSYQSEASLPQRKQAPKRRVDVVPGGGKAQALSSSHAFALKAAKVAVACAIAFSGIGVGRIALANATVVEAMQARDIKNNMEDMRSSISDMQVEQSALSNPARIKSEAEALGMASPVTSNVLDLSGDVVATGENGELSLTESLVAASSVDDGALS